jgi:muramoyltetrapeptide carboxypeptidase
MSDSVLSRRDFGRLLTAASLGAAAPAFAATGEPVNHLPPGPKPTLARAPSRHTRLIKPPRLRQGDIVGLIAPAGHTDDAGIEKAVKHIEELGFKARLGANLREVRGNYAGTVQQRLDDLHAMFADREVKAIWCIRGGSGAISLLSGINYRLIRSNPKILLGYSDITALHLALHRHARLVTFHGPVAQSGASDYSRDHMLALLCDPQPRTVITMADENRVRAATEPQYAVRTVHGGIATGPLIGGNLSLVSALVGTPYAADYHHAILFLEEVNEAPYRIDRWMTQLDLSIAFKHAAALMVGICEKCEGKDEDVTLSLNDTLDIHLQPLKVPAVTGYSFGHIRHQFTLPVGVMATLDTEAQTLTLLEAGVS